MKNDPIPNDNHVSRHCGFLHIDRKGRITGQAFRPRVSEEYLSVNWLEYFKSAGLNTQMQEIRTTLMRKGRKIGAQSKFAVLNVGELKEYVGKKSVDGSVLSVLHEPEENDPSHSGIYGVSVDDFLIAEIIAEFVREEMTFPGLE